MAEELIQDKELNPQQILNELSKEDGNEEEKLPVLDETTEEKEEEEIAAEGEEEIALEGLDGEEKQEEIGYEPSIDFREINKKFPELRKEFPNLEKVVRREAYYAEVFPTVQEAKDAQESSETLKEFENVLFSGRLDTILNLVKNQDSETFGKITNGLMAQVKAVDENAYWNIHENVVREMLYSVTQSANQDLEDENNKQIALAAKIINKALFNSTEIKKPNGAVESKADPEKERLTAERQNFEKERFETAVSSVNTSFNTSLKNTIEKAIDPKQLMTGYIRTNAVKDCMDMVAKEFNSDKRFDQIIGRLWMESRKKGYTSESKSKIREALVTKAKTILPGIIQKVKSDAMKDLSVRRKEAAKDESPLPRGRVPNNRPAPEKNSKGKTEIPRNMSSREYLMQD